MITATLIACAAIYPPYPETFGAALQARREARGWSVPQLARAASLSRETVYALEAEKREPKPGTRVRLRVALGVGAEEDGGWWSEEW